MPPTERPMGPFGYHQVPADVIEDAEILVDWARKSVAVALGSRARKPRIREPGKKRAKKRATKRR
jgi:hypothetical protein